VQLGQLVERDNLSILRYRHRLELGYSDGVTPSGRILAEFIRLADVSDDRFASVVFEFASRYGVLGICRHGKPSPHGPCMELQDFSVVEAAMAEQRSNVVTVDGWLYYEPLEAWRRYSRQLRGILGVVARLQAGRPGLPEDWEAIVAGDPPEPEIPKAPDKRFTINEHVLGQAEFSLPASRGTGSEKDLMNERHQIALSIETWTRYGGVSLGLNWTPYQDHAVPYFKLRTLPAALATWLVSVAQGPVYVCSGCCIPFPLGEGKKRLPATRNKWCDAPTCGRAAMLRAAARRNYQKRRGSRPGADDSQPDSQASGRDGADGGRNGSPPGE